jgi:hypothetical protein
MPVFTDVLHLQHWFWQYNTNQAQYILQSEKYIQHHKNVLRIVQEYS